jgi:hypothetical protein
MSSEEQNFQVVSEQTLCSIWVSSRENNFVQDRKNYQREENQSEAIAFIGKKLSKRRKSIRSYSIHWHSFWRKSFLDKMSNISSSNKV